MIWFVAGKMKSAYCISAMGLRPAIAAPMATPAMADSDRGVSSTRHSPNRRCRSFVVPKTPPFTPTSSPSTKTRSSRSISSFMARRIASIYSRTGILRLLPVFRVDVPERILRRLERRAFGVSRGLVDDGPDALLQLPVPLFRPQTAFDQIVPELRDAVPFPGPLDLFLRPVGQVVVGSGMRRHPVGHHFDQRRPFSRQGPLPRFPDKAVHFQGIVAFHPKARKSVSGRPFADRGGRLLVV